VLGVFGVGGDITCITKTVIVFDFLIAQETFG